MASATQDIETALEPKASTRTWSRTAMHWIRRIHLYTGLFMLPWVMLYGITALLFNHPGAFADRSQRTLALTDFAGTALERVADAGADAEQVVAALNTKFGNGGSSPFRPVHPEKAGYARDVISARVRGAGQDHGVLFDLPSGTALVSSAAQADEERAPFAVRGLKVPGALAERIKTSLPKALARQGFAADEAGIAVGSELVFYIETGGRTWRASYSIQTGAVTGSPVDTPSDLSARRFLTQLHMSHGYPSHGGVRTIWAIAVDLMFVTMVFWGLSGLFMWWQIKAVRLVGSIVLVTSLVAATFLALGMHGSLSGP